MLSHRWKGAIGPAIVLFCRPSIEALTNQSINKKIYSALKDPYSEMLTTRPKRVLTDKPKHDATLKNCCWVWLTCDHYADLDNLTTLFNPK